MSDIRPKMRASKLRDNGREWEETLDLPKFRSYSCTLGWGDSDKPIWPISRKEKFSNQVWRAQRAGSNRNWQLNPAEDQSRHCFAENVFWDLRQGFDRMSYRVRTRKENLHKYFYVRVMIVGNPIDFVCRAFSNVSPFLILHIAWKIKSDWTCFSGL